MGLVENVVLLAAEVHAAHTIFAVAAFVEKGAVAALGAVLTVAQVVGVEAVHTVVSEFAVVHPVNVHGVAALHAKYGVVAVLTDIATKYEVAVFVVGSDVAVFAVFGVAVDEAKARDKLLELFELFEKGAGPINVAAVVHGVPVVAPPVILAVDSEGGVEWVEANHRLAGACAGAAVNSALVAIGQAALMTLLRCECGLGDAMLLEEFFLH